MTNAHYHEMVMVRVEFAESLLEIEKVWSQYRSNQTIKFYADPNEGHDDYLTSLALSIYAAMGSLPRVATGGQRFE